MAASRMFKTWYQYINGPSDGIVPTLCGTGGGELDEGAATTWAGALCTKVDAAQRSRSYENRAISRVTSSRHPAQG